VKGELIGYAPRSGDITLLQALLGRDDAARSAAEEWLNVSEISEVNEGVRRLLPLLHYRMTCWGMEHPKSALVSQEYRRYWLATQRVQYQADRLLEMLAPLKCPVVFLKGAALGRTVYPSRALRPLSDVDFLVPRHEFRAAQDILTASGFSLSDESWHASLLVQAGYPEVDLHKSPYHEAFSEALVAPIFSRTVELSHDCGNAHCLGAEDQLLHTIAHGLRPNVVSPIRWVVDAIHVLRAAGRSFSWDAFLSEAVRLDFEEVAARGLTILDSICPGEVDASTLSSLRERRSTLTGLMFMAEREWRGPPRVWGLVRRNGGWLERLDLISQHYAGALRWRYEALRANL